ncbi:hypothetical protein [Modestobacter sp. SYSU DS0875]
MRFPTGEQSVVGLCGPDGAPDFWLSPADGGETRELHVGFRAPDRAAVDAVHDAARAAGAEVLHGAACVARVPPRLPRRLPA